MDNASAMNSKAAWPQAVVAARQRGAVAIIVALSLLVLFGFAGLVLDLGRLYVNKTELQSAADACALAAARELTCDTASGVACPRQFLTNAETAGIFIAAQNRKDFQHERVMVAPGDVRFSPQLAPNANYLGSAVADVNSKFAMCVTRSTGILPWLMGLLGVGAQNVNAMAVATMAPSQNFCQSAPLGICKKTGSTAPDFGYSEGDWIASAFTSSSNKDGLSGGFTWIDFTPNAGGNSEIRDALIGAGGRCDLEVGKNVQQPGQQQGAKSAYNTRFGIYPNGANAYTPATAPPDRSGYAYPNKTPGNPVIGIGTSAFADYLYRQGSSLENRLPSPFIEGQYGVSGPGGNFSGNPIDATAHQQHGAERRLVNVPMVDCNAGNVTPVLGMACVLMLNPMSNGASGTIYIEYRGLSTDASSPCPSSGTPTGPGGSGPMVPTLVQ